MTPEDLLDELAKEAMFKKFNNTTRLPEVGQIVQSLPDDKRELLKQLTSDELINNRFPNR